MTKHFSETEILDTQTHLLNGLTTHGWYFWDDSASGSHHFGPYETLEDAEADEKLYFEALEKQ